jgi:hypothetical protein
MMVRRSYHMPELEWCQIVSDYQDGHTVKQVADLHLSSPQAIYTVLKYSGIRVRSASDARNLAVQLGYIPDAKFLPTPEEIVERARQVREEGFYGGTGKMNHRTWYPPWSPTVEQMRRVSKVEFAKVCIPILEAPRMNGHKLLNGDGCHA